MNLYLVERTDTVDYGNEFDSIVVLALSAEIAKTIHPYTPKELAEDTSLSYTWPVYITNLEVTLLGVASKQALEKAEETGDLVVHSSYIHA